MVIFLMAIVSFPAGRGQRLSWNEIFSGPDEGSETTNETPSVMDEG
jgi:hypothetical protein